MKSMLIFAFLIAGVTVHAQSKDTNKCIWDEEVKQLKCPEGDSKKVIEVEIYDSAGQFVGLTSEGAIKPEGGATLIRFSNGSSQLIK